jgi:nitrite reductase/ring-hydroxylating ferredoxin subunit
VALALTADAVVAATGYLGGHLSYSQGVGVDTTVFEHGPRDWTAVADEPDVPESEPIAVEVDGMTLLLVRRHGRLLALADRCTHRGGPLHEGDLEGDCITCPWHRSVFRLEDGHIVRGPATQPQPAYEVRAREGRIEVRRAEVKGLRATNP